MLKQTIEQKLQFKMTPNQILVQKLVALPMNLMEQKIKEEIENNPALEAVEEEESVKEDNNDEYSGSEADGVIKETDKEDEFDSEEFMDENDEYIPAYKLSINNSSSDDDFTDNRAAENSSLQDSLREQLRDFNLNVRQAMLCDYIIGNIDDDGYLRRDLPSIANDITFLQNIRTDEGELSPLLAFIQKLDPSGVGAGNLKECLLLQLKRKKGATAFIHLAIEILERDFQDFSNKNFKKLKEAMDTDEEMLKGAINEITKLDPKPGLIYSEENDKTGFITPDFIIVPGADRPEVVLNSNNSIGNLQLNPDYIKLADKKRQGEIREKEAARFARQKITDARNFINAIQERENTLFRVMNVIFEYQFEYFQTGDESKLRPMLLKDIAKIAGYDISTISRVVNSKYIQTGFGTFLLKKLFSESFHKESGEEVSVNEVKNLLAEIILNEDKNTPINDEAIMEILGQRGYHLARRTVAKYREQLGIPIARLRKEI